MTSPPYRGQCLCGGFAFEVAELVGPFELCHCSRCRRSSGSAYLAMIGAASSGFTILRGGHLATALELPLQDQPPGYVRHFCSACGCVIPDPEPQGDRVEIPAGLFDDELPLLPDRHIYTDHAPAWAAAADGLPQYTAAEVKSLRRHTGNGTAARGMARGGRREGLAWSARACGLGAVALALLVPVIGAWLQPGYDHNTQYISELGAAGAAHGQLISLYGFLPTGLLVAAFVILGWRTLAVSKSAAVGCVLFLGVAAGYVIAALAPCDPGCPVDGSSRQALHNVGGLLEYLGGGLGLLLIGSGILRRTELKEVGATSLVLGTFVLVVFYALGTDPEGMLIGAWQRMAEAALFGWIAVACLADLSPQPQSPEPSSE